MGGGYRRVSSQPVSGARCARGRAHPSFSCRVVWLAKKNLVTVGYRSLPLVTIGDRWVTAGRARLDTAARVRRAAPIGNRRRLVHPPTLGPPVANRRYSRLPVGATVVLAGCITVWTSVPIWAMSIRNCTIFEEVRIKLLQGNG